MHVFSACDGRIENCETNKKAVPIKDTASGRSFGRLLFAFRLLRGFTTSGSDGELQEARDIWVELDLNFESAGVLDRLFELDLVAVEFDLGIALEHSFGNVHVGDGTESFACLPCLEGELQLQLLELGGDLLSFLKLFGLTLSACGLQMIQVAEVTRAGLEGLALGNQEIASEATLHFHDIGLGTETFDFFFEDDFDVCHSGYAFFGRGADCTRPP